MWNRSEIKASGKSAFKANYWNCVIVELILGVLLAAQVSSSKSDSGEGLREMIGRFSPTALLGGVSVALVISILVQIFIKNPLVVGGHRFFLNNSHNPNAKANDMLFVYREGSFLNIFITMFLKDIFLALWTMLFVVPGIIKYYSYRMVPFILAENPEIEWKEAIDRSRHMMNGHKMNCFILDLSFLGWLILSGLTAGVLGVLYVNPYMRATYTELYTRLR